MRLILCLAAMLIAATGPALACGSAATRCDVEAGYYIAAAPPGWDGTSALPVVVYFHGWNGSPEGAFRNRAMVDAVHRRGALFVAPWARLGYWRQIGVGRAEAGRDELAYTRRIMADLARRWPVDAGRTVASGFSRGASLVWNLACYGADLFAGFAPIAGGFWHSTPADCPTGPVRLRHIHGLRDRVVAFNEVGVYDSMPILDGMALLRAADGAGEAPEMTYTTGTLDCDRWTGQGGVLELCLHDGGHSIPAEWVAESLDWLDELHEGASR